MIIKTRKNYNDLCPLGYDRLDLRWPQVHTLGFHPLWCSPALRLTCLQILSLLPCRSQNSSLNDYWCRQKICPQIRKQEVIKIKHWFPDRCRTSKARTRSSPTKVAEAERLQQRWYLQLPVSAHYACFLWLLQPLTTWFPLGTLLDRMDFFSVWFTVPKTQHYKLGEFIFYHSFPFNSLASKALRFPACHHFSK